MTSGIHRVTANSKAGRQMTSGGGVEHDPYRISEEIRKWNAKVDAEKKAKAEAKLKRFLKSKGITP